MIRIGICEDNPEQLQKHKELVQTIMAKLFKNIELFCFQSGEDLLCEIDTTGNMDIILLDIEMTGINGIETAKLLREKDTRAVLIFVSSYDQYFKEMIDVQPFAFIDKPVSEERLEQVLTYALKSRFSFHECYCFSNHKTQYTIPLTEIQYFQSDKRIIYMYTCKTEYSFYGKMDEVEKDISGMSNKFIRVRKSFLINSQFIKEYTADKVVLDNDMVVEISKKYKESVRKHYVSILRERP